MKIDPYKHKERYLKWKITAEGIKGVCEKNSDAIMQYLSDMENGLNVSSQSVKGPRSFVRLNNLKQRLTFLARKIEEHVNVALTEISEEQLVIFFNAMRNGTIKRSDGKQYQSVADYVNPFKAFWHWHMKVSKKTGVTIVDITVDLDASKTKPKWVYLTEEQVQRLCEYAKPDYRALILFLYDTGIRSPTELINVRVSDLSDDCKQVHIREEIVKKGSFGRKIKLMLCSSALKRHITDNGLQSTDQLFGICPSVTNRYLKRLAKRVLGESTSLAGEIYANLTMYDFRHCACCYWLPRYKSESALKYRFGWRKSDKIHYYSEMLGMKDTICEEDMLIDQTKTEIERKLVTTERENTMLRETLESHSAEVAQLKALMQEYVAKLSASSQVAVHI